MRYVPFLRVIPAIFSMIGWAADLRTVQAPAVQVGICPRHRFSSLITSCIAYLALPLSLSVWLTGAPQIVMIWAPVIGLICSAVAWSRPRPVKAVHVGIGFVTLAGPGAGFLESLPPRMDRGKVR
ncbi:MAG TPA: hypothetical protein VFE47_13190 [Tepidisphaeraceae bacterium]|jgi:hypothetical protein|nr:hypothetical protein [Tepidisphaeraceae bacterium]